MTQISTGMCPKSLALLTQGTSVPSSRFRILQHHDALVNAGFQVEHLPAHWGAYPPEKFLQRGAWLSGALFDAVRRVVQVNRSELCFLQRELVSTLVTAEPLIKRPFVFDVDDAIFLHRRGRATDRIAARAALILCGNRFLADHYAQYGAVHILPTAVDTQRFRPDMHKPSGNEEPVIGWSGTSSGFKYLYEIEGALVKILQRYPGCKLFIIADRPPQFGNLPHNRIRFEYWNPDAEAAALREFTIGLMPLPDDDWARGKCSFKMLTYMATGLPVVVSPVGMNAEVLSHGNFGYAAITEDDWIDGISALINAPEKATSMGRLGRHVVEQYYARDVIGRELISILQSIS